MRLRTEALKGDSSQGCNKITGGLGFGAEGQEKTDGTRAMKK